MAVAMHLDEREQNGYEVVSSRVYISSQDPHSSEYSKGLIENVCIYIANDKNDSFLGPDTLESMTDHIASSHGPSGSNAEYLIELYQSLKQLQVEDVHVESLYMYLMNKT